MKNGIGKWEQFQEKLTYNNHKQDYNQKDFYFSMLWWCTLDCHFLLLTENPEFSIDVQSCLTKAVYLLYTHIFLGKYMYIALSIHTHIHTCIYRLYKFINKHITSQSFHWQGKFTFSKVPPHPIYTSLYRYTQRVYFHPSIRGNLF